MTKIVSICIIAQRFGPEFFTKRHKFDLHLFAK